MGLLYGAVEIKQGTSASTTRTSSAVMVMQLQCMDLSSTRTHDVLELCMELSSQSRKRSSV